MIIIKTKNGDHFINEKAVTEVRHDREHATASYYGANGCFNNIADVECIMYTNDAQPTSWTDEGSEVARLLKSCNEKAEYISKLTKSLDTIEDDLRDFAHEMIQIVQYHHDRMPDEICQRMRKRGEELKAKVNHNDYRPQR